MSTAPNNVIPFTAQLPPHDQNAEECVLGACLMNQNALDNIIKFLTPNDFFLLRNGWVFEAMMRLRERELEVDYITLANELRMQNRLTDIGGLAYLTYLLGNTPTANHAESYAWIVFTCGHRRRMLETADELRDLANAEDKPALTIFGLAVDKVTTLQTNFTRKSRLVTGKEDKTFASMLDEFMAFVDTGLPDSPMPTGIPVLDDLLMGGFFFGWLIVLASRMKVGKTRLMTTMALNMAQAGKRVVFYCTEEEAEGIMRKMITMLTGVSEGLIRTKRYTDIQRHAIQLATAHLKRLPIQIYNASGWTIPMMREHYTNQHVASHGKADAVFADYIQRFEEHRMGFMEKEHAMYGKIAQDMKNMAVDFNLVLVTASQYNRTGANGKGANDTLAGSDQIAREADLVIGIDRPETYEEQEERKRRDEVDLTITASRHEDLTGRKVVAGFNKRGGWFCDLNRVELDPPMLTNAKMQAMRSGSVGMVSVGVN